MKVLVALVIVAVASAEGDFPPPNVPKAPQGFNIHCDVCEVMMKRVQPYCEREEENLDYLPDFCIFNYNKVLRTECDYMVDVMEYVWCPNACKEVRKLKSFSGGKICHHPLVNCTERVIPSASPSPSPSPSAPVPADCVLCEFILKNVAEMCMNSITANKKNIYHVCMERTHNHQEFEHCQMWLAELVEIAGTEDPCSMLDCSNPKVTCRMDQGSNPPLCHVAEYDGSVDAPAQLGMDGDGNIFKPDMSQYSIHATTTGLGPGDFRPGMDPYHAPGRTYHLPPHVYAGHLRAPRDPNEPIDTESIDAMDAEAMKDMKDEHSRSLQDPVPAPVPLRDIKMQ